jgi:hypothetical protein
MQNGLKSGTGFVFLCQEANRMRISLIIFFFLFSLSCMSQESGIIPVASINNDILILNNYRETEGALRMYEKVLIVQMETNMLQQVGVKGAAGDAGSVPKKYVVVTITEVERSEGVIKSIRVSSSLQNTFVISNNSSIHVARLHSRWNW